MTFEDESKNTDGRHRQGFIAEINITPFVDVCLVLLIIFMVTAPFAISGVNVKLPKTQAKSLSLSNQSLVLSVTKSGSYFLGKSYVNEEELMNKIAKEIENEKNPAIFISADRGVPYGKVMYAMAAAQRAGVERIGMVGENKNEKK